MSLEEIQQEELKILNEIDSLCEKIGITYFGVFGTLIGAIRHRGFIPWDDDLDICMERSDYEKFLKYFKNQYDGNLILHHVSTVKNYPYYIARICETSHKLVYDNSDYTSGIFVDIYPFDGMGNDQDQEFWKSKRNAINLLKKKLIMSSGKTIIYGRNVFNKIGNVSMNIICHIKGEKYYFNKIDKLSQKFRWQESKYVGLPAWSNYYFVYNRTDFERTIRVPFGNSSIAIPENYDTILRDTYGDYMKLPPESERVPHHGYVAYKP